MARWRAVLTSQITAICVMLYFADITFGTFGPTFSLFAEQVGITVAVIGVINMLSGLASLGISLPAGSLSDRMGRPLVIKIGIISLGLGPFILAISESLVPVTIGRILSTVGLGLVVRTASAHLGDITQPGKRALAFSFFATSLGAGFTTGSLLAGQLSGRYSFSVAYMVAAGTAAIALIIAILVIRSSDADAETRRNAPRMIEGFRRVAGHRPVQLASIASFLSSVTFAGTILTLFPLYAKELGIGTAAVGTLFAVRGFVSTTGRIPNGLLARRFGDFRVMVVALSIEAIVMFGIWFADDTAMLMTLFAIEGLIFGGFMVVNQLFIAEAVETEVRGAAVGFTAVFAGVGSTIGPLMLGFVADAWGVGIAFPITGVIIAIGVGMILLGRITSPVLASSPVQQSVR